MDQDSFNLNLFPDFSENLISCKQYSNDSLEYFEKGDKPFYEKGEEKDKFVESFQKVFNPFTADNKKDSLTEVYDINNIDEFIIHFQKELDYYYFKKEFECIIEIIEKRFPYFFNEKTNGLLYLIQKLKFYELLRQDRIKEAKDFYKEKLLILVKEIKKEKWTKKSQFFIKLIKNPKLLLKQGELQKKYYDKYSFELEKAIRNFLNEEYDNNNNDENNNNDFSSSKNNILLFNSNSSLNQFKSSSSIDFNNIGKANSNNIEDEFNKTKFSDKIKKENIGNNEEEKDDLDLENCSTKEEFSDFEDEIQQKCIDNNQEQKEKNEETEKNTINILKLDDEDNEFYINNDDNYEQEFNLSPINEYNSPDFSSNIFPFSSKSIENSFPFIEKDNNIFNKTEKNEFIIDTSSKNLQKMFDEDKFNNDYDNIKEKKSNINFEEINTNINVPQNKKKEKKKYQKKKKDNKEETIFNQLPYLNSFKPKYIKRETIDKKIIRSFKNYVVKEYKSNKFEINETTMDQNFFINLINGNLLPPLDFHDLNTDEYIKFNSFNCSYLLWFFSKKGVKEIYNQFITEKGKEFVNDMSQYYEISLEEKNQLNSYIMNFPYIFDISLVNNITQGTTIKHLYRTVDKNKRMKETKRKKENDLDLKRIKSGDSQRERSRSRDFDNSD